MKFNSRLKLYTSVSTAIACIVGGVLYPFSQSLPYLLQGIIMVFATVMLLFLQPIKVKQEDKFSFLKQIKTATRVLSKKKIVFYLMISIFFINLSFNIFLHLTCQSFWLEKGITISEIGVIGAVIFIIDGLVSSFTSKIWSKFGEKNCYLLLAILSVVVQILLAFSNTLITITILSGLMFGIASIVGYVFDFSLQKRIKDATRATTSSISNMFLSLGYRVGLVGVGAMLALMTYSTSLILLASTFGIIGILLTLILLIKKNFK